MSSLNHKIKILTEYNASMQVSSSIEEILCTNIYYRHATNTINKHNDLWKIELPIKNISNARQGEAEGNNNHFIQERIATIANREWRCLRFQLHKSESNNSPTH